MSENEYILSRLFELQDIDYKNFHSKLIPTVNPDVIIGVRTPALRKLSAELWKNGYGKEFIKELPHKYYEENNLHGFFIEKMKNYDDVIIALDKFLPFVDNWATCDMLRPKVFAKNTDRLFEKCKEWIASDKTYVVRFGIGMLMSYFLEDEFSLEIPKLVSDVHSDEYYINMMSAWFFATALAKQYDSILPFFENKLLDVWVHNKTIQKTIESYRITAEQKKYLRTLKIK